MNVRTILKTSRTSSKFKTGDCAFRCTEEKFNINVTLREKHYWSY